MAAAISYFATAKVGYGRATGGVVTTDGSGTYSTFTWAGGSAPSADWMLTKIIFSSTSATAVGDLADSLIFILLNDGTNKRLFRTIDPGNPAAGSTTLSAYQTEVTFGPEFIFPSSVTVEFAVSVTPTAGNLDAVIFAQQA